MTGEVDRALFDKAIDVTALALRGAMGGQGSQPPAYAAELFREIWGALKDHVSANRSFAHLLVLGQFIRAFFDDLTPARALTLAGVQQDFCQAT